MYMFCANDECFSLCDGLFYRVESTVAFVYRKRWRALRSCWEFISGLYAAPAEDDVDDDGGAEDGRHGVEGEDGACAGKDGQEVAEQGHGGAEEHGDGQEHAVVGAAEGEPGDVRHGQADEGDGATEGCGGGCQQAGAEEDQDACAADFDAEVGGIAFAQEQGVEGLDEQEGGCESGCGAEGEEGQAGVGDGAEVAHAPHDVAADAVGGGVEVEQGDERRGDVADHDAEDEQHDVAPDAGGEVDDQREDAAGAGEGGQDHGQRSADGGAARGQADGAAEEEHGDGYAEVGAVADAEDGGAGQGVAEKRLEEQTRGGE